MLLPRRCLVPAVTLLALSCSATGDSGRLIGPDRVVAAVGQTTSIDVELASPSGAVTFDFGFTEDVDGVAQLEQRNDGTAVITFRPTGRDLGTLGLRIGARDGVGYSKTVVDIEVRSTVGSATLPKFQRPDGEGTSLATASQDCVEIEVLIDDQDTADVALTEEAPLIEGGTLQLEGEGAAIWRWCPTENQRAQRDRYLLTLGADDGDNPKVLKRYLIVLDGPGKLGCPGDLPVITHEAAATATLDSVAIRAEVRDREGLKAAPLVRYIDPSPVGQKEKVQLTMELADGDSRAGTWEARIPNPVVGKAAGESIELRYEIIVEDNDGRGSDCDHRISRPFTIEVTRPIEGPALAFCESCENDAQCGGDKDLCLSAGAEGGAICSLACDSDDQCPTGAYCSPKPLTSVNGNVARQCVPEDDVCEVDSCNDNRLEPNDTRAEAAPLEPGIALELKICPVGHLTSDEDWYELNLTEDSQLDFGLEAGTYPNLDVRIFDGTGALVAASEDWGSQDTVSRCLPAGTYHARVYSSFAGENDYQLSYMPSPMTCAQTQCIADPYEDDDSTAGARLPDFEGSVYRVAGNSICSGDQDWFEAFLFSGETIYATLDFEQNLPTEDLDILVYDENGSILTPCTADDLSGCSDNGQSGTSNESFEFTSQSAGKHFIVVNGFDGSENDYDICMALQPGLCP